MSLLTFILLIAVTFLYLRLRVTRRLIGEMIDSARNGRSILLDRTSAWIRGARLDEVIREMNRLIENSEQASNSGKEAFSRIQTMLGNLREAVLMVDPESNIKMANPAFEELVAVSADPLGKRLDLFIKGEAFHEFLHEVRKSGEGRRKELEVEVSSGTRWLEVSAAPLQDTPGSEDGFTLFVFHDVTRQKRLEKMRTEFVANVSHELRTPVTVIKGFAETLIDDRDVLSDKERVRFLRKIRNNSERLHNLLQDLLLLSRLESTELVLQLEKLTVSALIHEVVDSWEPVLADAQQKLVLELSGENDVILADPLRLTQVLTNLLDNVVRHAKGFDEIRIKSWHSEKGVWVAVIDNGHGIPEKDLPHVFQRFYRVDKGRSRESGGTGLGLSIVKHIIVQHRGEIRARSEGGKGTSIEFFLPYASRLAESDS